MIFTSGTGPTTGTLFTITFADTWASTPWPVISGNDTAAALGLSVHSVSTTTLVINCSIAPAASTSGYTVYFHCLTA